MNITSRKYFSSEMKTRGVTLLSIISTAIAANPCEDLCRIDGPAVCTEGSWERDDGVCHAYFLRSTDQPCYHNAETIITCPDTLPALTVRVAEAIVRSRSGVSVAANPISGPRVDPVVSLETTTTSTTTSSTTTVTEQRRRVVPAVFTTVQPVEVTVTPISVQLETTTASATTTVPQRTRRVFPVGQAVVTSPQPVAVDTTNGTPDRRRRVFPVGQAPTARSTVVSTSPSPVAQVRSPLTYALIQYQIPAHAATRSFSTPGAAADYIGAAFMARAGSFGRFTSEIAFALSRPDASSWPSSISRDDAMDFWTRSRGADLLGIATGSSCVSRLYTECLALLVLISHMPLPNTDSSSSLLFLEEIGVAAFIDANMENIRTGLGHSTRDMHFRPYYYTDGAGHAAFRAWARNWMTRFPQIIGDSVALRAVVLRHQIVAADLLSPSSSGIAQYVQLLIDRASPLSSLAGQLRRYSAASLRQGISRVDYLGETAGGGGLTREFYSVIASAVHGEGASALFATHNASGFERMIGGLNGTENHRAFGLFLALSLVSGNPTGVLLPPMFFSRLLGQAVSLDDVQVFDEDWTRTARLYMGAGSNEDLLAFSLGDPEPFPGSGATEPVTMENRATQVQQAIENIITNNSPAQFAAIAEGFFFVLPRELFAGFEGQDLYHMLVGNTDIDANELIAHMNFGMGPEQSGWLRQIIRDFTPNLRQRFLRFVTGLSVVPVGGWGQMSRLQISPAVRIGYDGRIVFPRSQTCFASMYLPNYESLEEMREILTNVLTTCIDAGMQER